MAKQQAIWVIVTGSVPTSFRAREREALLPTLKQLQRKHPDTRLMWFDRGRFWDSPEAAEAATAVRLAHTGDRKKEWRPGGAHVDPRAKYQISRDQKRARFKQRLGRPASPSADQPQNDRPGVVKGWNPEKKPRSTPTHGVVKGWNPEKKPGGTPSSGGRWKPSASAKPGVVKGWNPEKKPKGTPSSGGRWKPSASAKPGVVKGWNPEKKPSGAPSSRGAWQPRDKPGGSGRSKPGGSGRPRSGGSSWSKPPTDGRKPGPGGRQPGSGEPPKGSRPGAVKGWNPAKSSGSRPPGRGGWKPGGKPGGSRPPGRRPPGGGKRKP